MASIPKLHWRSGKNDILCGRKLEICKVTETGESITCANCRKMHEEEVKLFGSILSFYIPEPEEEVHNVKEKRQCLKCEKSFVPKTKYNFNCGCVNRLDIFDYQEHALCLNLT